MALEAANMRRLILALSLISGIALLGITTAEACGDKSLRIGRGIRFKRTSHPVAILIFIPSNASRATQLQSVLKKVGHKPNSVQGVDAVTAALKSGQYDVIFTDLVAAASLETQIAASPSKPVLIPVVAEGTKAEVSAAQKQYKCFVNNPHIVERYLDAIDEAMRSKVHLLTKKV